MEPHLNNLMFASRLNPNIERYKNRQVLQYYSYFAFLIIKKIEILEFSPLLLRVEKPLLKHWLVWHTTNDLTGD